MSAYNNAFPVTYPQMQPVPPMYYPQQFQAPVSQPPMQQPVAQPQPVQSQITVQQAAPAPQTANNPIIWVQGEAGAKSFLVAPNTTVQLWDSENQTIYLKSADVSGMPSMKILDYTIRDSAPANGQAVANVTASDGKAPDFALKEDFALFQNELLALRSELASVKNELEGTRTDLDYVMTKRAAAKKREVELDGKSAV